MSAMKKIVFVTGNANKLKEVQAILSGLVEINSKNIDIEEIQGTSQEVAINKCKRAALETNGPVLTEDTCLCFNAMNGLPGPYVKWFLKSLGPQGLYNMLCGFEDKSGYALCTFAYCSGPGHDPILFEGKTHGTIVPPRGPTTFGWDPVFQPDGHTQTYAEMEPSLKNTLSHRYKALSAFKEFLDKSKQ